MEVLQSSVQLNFNLEIQSEENNTYTIRLINLYNNFCYVPEVKTNFQASHAEAVKNTGFEIKDLLEIDNPVVIINGCEFKFKYQLSRIELENMLLQHGTRNYDIKFIKSEIEQLKNSSFTKLKNIENSTISNSQILASTLEEKDSKIKILYEKLEKVKEKMKLIDVKTPELEVSQFELTESDKRFQHIAGKIRYCCGDKCLQIGNIWGSNPYAYDEKEVNFCVAARHSGIVSANGGFYEIKLIGNIESFEESTHNGISSIPCLNKIGFSIHKVYNKSLIEGKQCNTCDEV